MTMQLRKTPQTPSSSNNISRDALVSSAEMNIPIDPMTTQSSIHNLSDMHTRSCPSPSSNSKQNPPDCHPARPAHHTLALPVIWTIFCQPSSALSSACTLTGHLCHTLSAPSTCSEPRPACTSAAHMRAHTIKRTTPSNPLLMQPAAVPSSTPPHYLWLPFSPTSSPRS